MAYVLNITPDGWTKSIDISANARILSSLGRYQLAGPSGTGTDITFNTTISPAATTGGTGLIIPNSAVQIQQLSDTPLVNILKGASISGSTLTINAYYSLGQGNANYPAFDLNLFEIPAATPGSYGIAMYDATDFCAITDVSRFGYVVYRDTITVNGSWSIPTSIPNISQCVVFARWNDSTTPVWFDRDSNQIRTYTGFSSTSGSSQGGTVSNIQIVIVATGFSPAVPDSGYGVVIRNASNVITYSSKYPPVIWRGGMYSFPYYLENSTGSASKVSWVTATGNVSQPMVPLGCYGFQCGDYATSGTYPKKVALLSGLLMSGNSVSTYRAKPAGGSIYYYQYPVMAQAGISVPCIDAADYF